jgi:hypothetical protein
MGKLIKLSVCLTSIPKDKILNHANGKQYVSIDCWVNDDKAPDKFGKDVTLNITPTKEEREAKANKIWVGAGETKWGFEKKEAPANKAVDDETDDIPW